MNSILPFYSDVKYKNECRPCCKNFEETFKLPIGDDFIPFRIELDDDYGQIANYIDFFDTDDNLLLTKEILLDSDLCDGKTVITNNNFESNDNYILTSSNWTVFGSVTFNDLAEFAEVSDGSFIVSANPLPANSKIKYEVFVTSASCPTDTDYSIVISNSQGDITLYEGNECKGHAFDITTGDLPTNIRMSVNGSVGSPANAVRFRGGYLSENVKPFLPNCFEGYARIDIGMADYMYSENFKVHEKSTLDECYIRINYNTGCNDCPYPFEGYFYLPNGDKSGANSSNALAQFESEVIGDTDEEGNFIEESVTVWKVLNVLATAAPEYFVDFLNYLQMYDITLTQFGKVYNIENFVEIETTWNLSGCFANVRMFLRVGTMRKIKCC